ncbi:MAG TPA: hypothetical protein VGX27_09990 [Candidatus Dormibacteraeota bacterium]|nr:hypothetical protein [Candidatus Dormibacteraeota bacterium]
MKGDDLPWFSNLSWWQKLLVAVTIFVVLFTLLLLPKKVFAAALVVGTVINVALGFWRGYRNRRL